MGTQNKSEVLMEFYTAVKKQHESVMGSYFLQFSFLVKRALEICTEKLEAIENVETANSDDLVCQACFKKAEKFICMDCYQKSHEATEREA